VSVVSGVHGMRGLPSRERPVVHATRVPDGELPLNGEGDHPAWALARPTAWETDFAGRPSGSLTRVRFLYSRTALYVLWELEAAGFNVDVSRFTHAPRPNLYEEDCVEIFLTPDASHARRYFEIELGPYGHYWELDVNLTAGTKDASWSSQPRIYTSRDRSLRQARIEVALTAASITAALAPGARLPLGLFRMEGVDPRQYLAWSPPRTATPSFHVPEAFGALVLDP